MFRLMLSETTFGTLASIFDYV
ncbi:hypothetical protein F383_29181 [Gossypium arboreum]|uniref:Uncharacterized protein n=1 Tax=Gossypium arboreum TaxID=29729 RepID=A0A0B0MZG1_GOSAR|nr:hypothetical protein F383_29181 [Gossypium arboreum]